MVAKVYGQPYYFFDYRIIINSKPLVCVIKWLMQLVGLKGVHTHGFLNTFVCKLCMPIMLLFQCQLTAIAMLSHGSHAKTHHTAINQCTFHFKLHTSMLWWQFSHISLTGVLFQMLFYLYKVLFCNLRVDT